MRHWMPGGLLLLALATLLNGCKSDSAPVIAICIGDGLGGADCDLPKGHDLRERCEQEPPGAEGVESSKFYCPPSVLETAWITTQDDAKRLLSWCYKTPQGFVERKMREKAERLQAVREPAPVENPSRMEAEALH